MAEHIFGGPWTEVKLDAVLYYLECYTKALSQRSFQLWYIDAFAGSGSREIEISKGGIFDGTPIRNEKEVLAGSARRALQVKPPFNRFTFIETDMHRRNALEELRRENVDRNIEVIAGEANIEIEKIVTDNLSRKANSDVRGVVFLDPYALQVNWNTLLLLATTQKVDVWYLFPLRDVTRQLAIKQTGIGPKGPMLDRVLGPEWRDLYSLPNPETPQQLSMLDSPAVPERNVTQAGIERWFQKRLENVFAYASPPLPILTETGRQIFSLFLAVSNPSLRAINLAKHFQAYSFKQAGARASRQRFVL